jgi:hypothetical protein
METYRKGLTSSFGGGIAKGGVGMQANVISYSRFRSDHIPVEKSNIVTVGSDLIPIP